MKTSTYDEPCDDDESMASYDSFETTSITSLAPSVISSRVPQCYNEPPPVPCRTIRYSTTEAVATPASPLYETSLAEEMEVSDVVGYRSIELVSPEEVLVQKVEIYNAERWSDTTSVSLPGQIEDVETVTSDTEPGNAQCEPISEMYFTASSEISLLSDTEVAVDKGQTEDEDKERDDRKNVIAGHVAAMRERFESMTRTNTPCPDLIRSMSPSLEVFRNTTPSPDQLA